MANSYSESLGTEDCQKKVLRKWNLLTGLMHQFPKCLLLTNIQPTSKAGYWAGTQPLFLCWGPSAHWTHIPQTRQGLSCNWVLWILTLQLALLADWGRWRGDSHSHPQLPWQNSGQQPPALSVFCWCHRSLLSRQSSLAGSTLQEAHTASMCPGVRIEIKWFHSSSSFYTFLFQLSIVSAQ